MNPLDRLRASFVTGLLLVAPLAVTLFVLDVAVDWLTGVLTGPIRATRLAEYVGSEPLAQALAAVTLALSITAVGFVASNEAGRRLFGGFERGVGLLPVVRTVYFGVRQVSESLSTSGDSYDRVVVAEYPRRGVYALGFVTNRAPRRVSERTDEDLSVVFFPHSPNPTAGKLAMLPDEELVELDMSVSRGLRLIVTTGLSIENPEELPEPMAQ
ncbi:DUF502 domain-containing protein [Halorarum halophilum]|uniref:DUF502 domain-containing protein n=1 Tax=Halorarum halophilum TaxID=2743090 RepID=A0A7D5GZ05_9EURY|nr:DUF502 domain-containing protein [Halobaculum halophilum]QLG29129.1 DUF502 domain-containing protein [Halobaculum halophilum]